MLIYGLIGYLTAFSGLLPGTILTIIAGHRVTVLRYVMGFTGGLLIGFVCFEIIPRAMDDFGLYKSLAGIIAGILTAVYIETVHSGRGSSDSEHMPVGVFSVIALAIHNFPEGIALGTVLSKSFGSGLTLCAALAVHCIPESMAATHLLSRRFTRMRLLTVPFIMAFPMCLGTVIGSGGGVMGGFQGLMLAYSGGIMLYITCGSILPDNIPADGNGGTVRMLFRTIISGAGFIAAAMLV